MKKISVIVPIYGVEKYLKEALDNIINQKILEQEIILIDNESKDHCPQIIDEYAKKDNRIISIHKENGDYGQTCNIGLERATGEISFRSFKQSIISIGWNKKEKRVILFGRTTVGGCKCQAIL